MDNHDFCRTYLKVTRAELTAEQKRRLKGAWSYMYSGYNSTGDTTYLTTTFIGTVRRVVHTTPARKVSPLG